MKGNKETKKGKAIEKAMEKKKGVVASSKAPNGHKDWDSYYGRSPSNPSSHTEGFRGTKKEFLNRNK